MTSDLRHWTRSGLSLESLRGLDKIFQVSVKSIGNQEERDSETKAISCPKDTDSPEALMQMVSSRHAKSNSPINE